MTARLVAYAATAIVLFASAASVGAIAALVVRDDLSWPGGGVRSEGPSPVDEQGASSQHEQATYARRVGEIQADSVETFSDSHEKLLRYDSLTSGDIEKMRANQAALQGFVDQASKLNAPQEYGEQKVAFLSAIDELHQAAELAYALAANPTTATQSGFRRYDGHVNKAETFIQRSDELLGRDYKTLEGVRSVNTS